MHDAVISIAVTAWLAFGTTLTGRAVACLCRIQLLRRPTPESLFGSAFLGTAVWILGFGACSYLGLSALPAALVVLGLSTCLLGWTVMRRRVLAGWSRSRGAALAVALLPVVCAVAAALLSVLLYDCYQWHSDAGQYDSVAEWLQFHGFGEVYSDAGGHRIWDCVGIMQTIGHRMGPMFLLAMTRAVSPVSLAIEVYPAVNAWGVALNIAAVYVLCRWTFRCHRAVAFTAALTASGFNPLSYSSADGFLCQIYGTAVLLFTLAVLSRLVTRSGWRPGGAFLYAVSAALLLSVYSELSPILAVASVVYLSVTLLRAWRASHLLRFLLFAGSTLLLFLLFANVEVVRAVRSVLVMVNVNGVGRHLDWTNSEFWSFAMGATGCRPGESQPHIAAARVATAITTVCLCVGLLAALRSRRRWFPLAALFTMGALYGFYHWVARDPWTAAVGHTWNEFKLCNWAYPLVVAVQGAGLQQLLHLRRLKGGAWPRRVVVSAACVTILVAAGWQHWRDAKVIGMNYQDYYHNKRPLTALRRERKQLSGLGADSFYFFPRTDFWRSVMVPYLASPLPFYNGWPVNTMFYPLPRDVGDVIPSPPPNTMIGLLPGEPPFTAPLQRLEGGLSALDLRRPVIIAVDNPNGVEQLADGAHLWIGSDAATFTLWSPCGGQGKLFFQAVPGPSSPGLTQWRLNVSGKDGPEKEIVVENTSSALPLTVRPGLNQIKVRCMDSPLTIVPLPGEGASVLLLGVAHARFELNGE